MITIRKIITFKKTGGFSALIETAYHKLLFDCGNNFSIFLSNAEKMKINFQDVTDVVFSHKHKDHITGCEEVLQKLQDNTRVYLPKGFPIKKIPKYKPLQIQMVKNFSELDKDIYSMPLRGGFFLHEQCLILKNEKGLVIVTGCAHPGIIKIIENAKKKLNQQVYFVLGGFHLFRDTQTSIHEIVKKTQFLQVEKVAPCHCSGPQTIEHFQKIYGNDFYKIGAGTVITNPTCPPMVST